MSPFLNYTKPFSLTLRLSLFLAVLRHPVTSFLFTLQDPAQMLLPLLGLPGGLCPVHPLSRASLCPIHLSPYSLT